MSRLGALLLCVASTSGSAQSTSWPPLPKQGFITGRAATQADVAAGNAIFAAGAGETIVGTPLQISIPQYAYHNEAGKKVPVVIVQAEEVRGKRIVGAREFGGQELAGLLEEFELLGTSLPNQVAP